MEKVPQDLCTALAANSKAKAQWKSLTPNERRDFVVWVNLVKASEKRSERVEKVCRMLAVGKRRP